MISAVKPHGSHTPSLDSMLDADDCCRGQQLRRGSPRFSFFFLFFPAVHRAAAFSHPPGVLCTPRFFFTGLPGWTALYWTALLDCLTRRPGLGDPNEEGGGRLDDRSRLGRWYGILSFSSLAFGYLSRLSLVYFSLFLHTATR